MAVVQPMLTPMFNPNVKDSRWLTLEVCREFQRTKCSRTENECKFAHPPPHVEVQNGRVTCCFDSIKGKCQRKEPPCKYLHPPQHLREQLLQNGRNNLILKNLQMQYIAAGLQPTMIPGATGVFPATQADPTTAQNTATSPEYRASPNPASYYTAYEQVPPSYLVSQNAAGAATFGGHQYTIPTVGGASVPAMLSVDANAAAAAAAAAACSMATPTTQVLTSVNTTTAGGGGGASTKMTRPDRLENNMGGLTGMMPVMKRPALDNKSGIPMYQPSAAANATAAYQQALAMQLQHQQQFVPAVSIAGHPPSVQRF